LGDGNGRVAMPNIRRLQLPDRGVLAEIERVWLQPVGSIES
jgi:hypothetical protein